MRTHKDLDLWKQSMDLVTKIYKTTQFFPKEEMYGLSSQMRRAAVSIPSNIAEGAARKYGKEFVQFLHVALGSASELETQILISERLGYLDGQNSQEICNEIFRIVQLINGLKKTMV